LSSPLRAAEREALAIAGASPGSGAIRASGMMARELLAPVYNWFTEGFDTLDLKEAKKFEELAV
jgi:predicted ATPase